MDNDAAYGVWWLVLVNSIFFIVFALSFTRPRTARDWRSLGVFSAFIVALFAAPLIGAVPAAATAPALVVVGGMMLSSIGEIPWDDVCIAFPAFLTLVMIPLTFSIANGLAFGLTSYVLIHLARGRGNELPKAAYPLAILLLIRFIYMGSRL